MYTLDIPEGLRVLTISPHADDVELGAGATLLWLQHERKADIYYRVMSTDHVKAEDGTVFSRASEARGAAAMLGVDVECELHYDAQNFVDAEFPEQRKAIHRYLERTKELIDPHLVISPSPRDMHQDHVTVAETVIKAMAASGGPTSSANLRNVRLTRPRSDGAIAYQLDLRAYLYEGTPASDLTLRAGDTITVPEKRSLGGVLLQGLFRIVPLATGIAGLIVALS